MDTNTNTVALQGAKPLTPLDLNNIKLDVQHTVLTPDYLENLPKE